MFSNFNKIKTSLTRGFTRTLTLLLFCAVSLKEFYLNKIITIFKFEKQNSDKTEARPKLVCGFTLVEMMVVVAIIIVVTAVVLLKQSKFSSDILVTNAAYEVALSIRQAQVYGISSKQSIAASQSNVGYGIFLNTAPTSSFIIYSDVGGGDSLNPYPFKYTVGSDCANDEYCLIDNPKLTQGQTIKRFCVVGNSGTLCSSGTFSSITSLDIGFIKPKPEAIIHDSTSNTNTDSIAIIVVASALGDKCRVVKITSIGQISVDAPRPAADECTNVSF